MSTHQISVVIPFYGDPDGTMPLVRSLQGQRDAELEIIVSDDASPSPFPETEGVSVIRREKNGGFGAAVNSGVAVAQYEKVLILNSDLEIDDRFVAKIDGASSPHMPCVAGCLMRDRQGNATYTARHFPKPRHYAFEWFTPFARFRNSWWWQVGVGHDVGAKPGSHVQTDWVVGAVMLMRTEDFRALGGFDERFFMNCEEVDLQRRLADEDVPAWFLGDVECMHEGGGSSEPTKRLGWLLDSRLRYANKWGGKKEAFAVSSSLYAVSLLNFFFNILRCVRNSEVKPKQILNRELSLLRGAKN